MKTLLTAVSFLISFGCSQPKENNPEQLELQAINADKSKSEMAAKDVFNNSILFYADSNIVKLSKSNSPVICKETFTVSYDKKRDIIKISWLL